MAALPIVTGENTPILRAKTKKVPKVTKEILKLIEDMEETTIHAKGAGIAAPQVNRSERICIAMIQRKLTPLINPEITWMSDEGDMMEEGCLSLPDLWMQVPRSIEIVLKYQDLSGKQIERKLTDYDARVVQHEVDHLDGILIVDYKGIPVTPLKSEKV
jgi:peptide deformylase